MPKDLESCVVRLPCYIDILYAKYQYRQVNVDFANKGRKNE